MVSIQGIGEASVIAAEVVFRHGERMHKGEWGIHRIRTTISHLSESELREASRIVSEHNRQAIDVVSPCPADAWIVDEIASRI